MIATAEEYQKTRDELRQLEERLARLQQISPLGEKVLPKLGFGK